MTEKKQELKSRSVALLFGFFVLAAGLVSQMFMVQSVYWTEIERVSAIRLKFAVSSALEDLDFSAQARLKNREKSDLTGLFLQIKYLEPGLAKLSLFDQDEKAQQEFIDPRAIKDAVQSEAPVQAPEQIIALKLAGGGTLEAAFLIEQNTILKQLFAIHTASAVLVIIVVSCVFLWLWPSIGQKKRRRSLVGAIVVGQLVFAVLVLVAMQTDLTLVQNSNKQFIVQRISETYQKLLDYGILPSEWFGADKDFALRLGEAADSTLVYVLDPDKRILFSSDSTLPIERQVFHNDAKSIVKELSIDGAAVAYLAVDLQADRQFADQSGLILGLLSLVLISILIALELHLVVFRRFSERFLLTWAAKQRSMAPKVRSFLVMRGLVFFFFVVNFVSFGVSWTNEQASLGMVSLYLVGVAGGGLLMRRLTALSNAQRATEITLLAAFIGTFVCMLGYQNGLLLGLSRLIAGLAHGGIVALNGVEEGDNSAAERLRTLWRRQISTGFSSGLVVGLCMGVLAYSRFSPGQVLQVSTIAMGVLYVLLIVLRPLAGTRLHLIGIRDQVFARGKRKSGLAAVLLLLGLMLPLQLASAGVFYFIFPVYMTGLGLNFALIARVLSIYALITMAGPIVRRRLEGYRQERIFLMAAYLLCGISLLAMIFSPDNLTIALAVLCVGLSALLGDGLSTKALFAYPTWSSRNNLESMPVFQLLERLNAAIVPLIAAGLVLFLEIGTTIVVIAVLALLGAVAMAWFMEGKGR